MMTNINIVDNNNELTSKIDSAITSYRNKESFSEKKESFKGLLEAALDVYEAKTGRHLGSESNQMVAFNIGESEDKAQFGVIVMESNENGAGYKYFITDLSKVIPGARTPAPDVVFTSKSNENGNVVEIDDNRQFDTETIDKISNSIANFSIQVINGNIHLNK